MHARAEREAERSPAQSKQATSNHLPRCERTVFRLPPTRVSATSSRLLFTSFVSVSRRIVGGRSIVTYGEMDMSLEACSSRLQSDGLGGKRCGMCFFDVVYGSLRI